MNSQSLTYQQTEISQTWHSLILFIISFINGSSPPSNVTLPQTSPWSSILYPPWKKNLDAVSNHLHSKISQVASSHPERRLRLALRGGRLLVLGQFLNPLTDCAQIYTWSWKVVWSMNELGIPDEPPNCRGNFCYPTLTTRKQDTILLQYCHTLMLRAWYIPQGLGCNMHPDG